MNHAIITATQETFIQQLTLLKKMQREIISVKKVIKKATTTGNS